MAAALFTLMLPVASYVAALSPIREEWSLNNTQAGVIFSAYLAGYAVSALVVIPLTDRFGPKPILIGSAVLSGTAQMLFPLVADDIGTGVALRAVAGVGLVGVYMPAVRVVAERFGKVGRGAAIGLMVTAFYAGNSVSLVATGRLLAVLEWREAYLVLALIALVGIPLSYLLVRGYRHTRPEVPSGRLDLGVLRNRRVRYLIFGYSLHSAELFVVHAWLPLFLVAVLVADGMDTARAVVTGATVGGLALASSSVGPVMGGIMSDRRGRIATASAIFALSGLCSWIIGWTGGWPWALIVALVVVYGWATSADSAIYTTAITEAVGPSSLGSAMALQAFIGFMGGVLAPIVFGGVLDLAPESIRWGVGFSAVGLLSVIAIASMVRLRAFPETSSPG